MTKQDLVQLIKDNFMDDNGIIDLNGLDFGYDECVLNMNYMHIVGEVNQCKYEGNATIYQQGHLVTRAVYQSFHENYGNVYQGWHGNKGHVFQMSHENAGDIYQGNYRNRGCGNLHDEDI